MSSEKARKLDTLGKLFQAMRSRTMLTRLSVSLLKLEHHSDLKKLSRWITKTLHSKYSFALRAHQEVRTNP